MRQIIIVIAAALSVGVGIGTAHQTYQLLWRPEHRIERRDETNFQSVLRYASMGAALIGVGYMLYKGVEGALWWLPRSWTVFNEDGEREWVGHGIALGIGTFGAIFLMLKLEELAIEVAHARRSQREK